jgi:PKD repeat protein
VTLTAKNLCDSQTKKLIVPVAAVCDPPAILIEGFTPLNPTVGDVVTFTASATGTLPISYTWRFENGSTVIGQEATYVFASPGMHVVDLIVENTCDQVEIEIDVPVEAIIHRYHLPMISR